MPAGPHGTPPALDILDAFALAGRGVFLRLRSDAPVVDGGDGPYVLTVVATPRVGPLRPHPVAAPYELLVRAGTPLQVTVAVVAPDGLRTERRTTVSFG